MTRWRRWIRRILFASALSLAVLLGFVALVNWQILRTTSEQMFTAVEDVPSQPVAIVLGARVYRDGTPSHALEDRLATARDLLEAGKVERILVSGDHGLHTYDEVHSMRQWLLDEGIEDRLIYMDHAGFRTLDSMFRAVEVFGIRRAVVCTQRFHLPRALYLARAAGMDAVGMEADRRVLMGVAYNHSREQLARVRAWLDIHVLQTRPKYLGPAIPIDGPAVATHDRKTE